jgi:H+/gluconate symporter-like permease
MLKGLFSQGMAEWGTACLVFISGAMAGRLMATGMNEIQAAGALIAIFGSVTAAVAVRIWPAPEQVKVRSDQDRRDR